MWLNPDFGGNSFDDENVNPVHSLHFCWGWQLFLISDDIEEGCAGLMAASGEERDRSWEQASSATANMLSAHSKQDSSCHTLLLSNARSIAYLWDLHNSFNLFSFLSVYMSWTLRSF